MPFESFEEQETRLRKAVRLAPDDAEAHYLLGDFLQAKYWKYQKRRKEAAEELQEAVRLNPGHDRAFARLVYVLLPVRKYEEAARAGREAIRLNPRYDNSITRWQIGHAYFLQGNFEEAEKEFRKSGPIRMAKLDLCETLWRQGKYEEAERELLRLLRLSQEDPEFHYNLGRCYAQWGKEKEALTSLAATLDKWSDSLEALLKEQTSPKGNRTQEAKRAATLQDMLRLQPCLEKDKEWDRLRKDKRFKELAASAKRLWFNQEKALKAFKRKRLWAKKRATPQKDE